MRLGNPSTVPQRTATRAPTGRHLRGTPRVATGRRRITQLRARLNGEGGIRTLGRGDTPTTVFETAAFDRSATSPRGSVPTRVLYDAVSPERCPSGRRSAPGKRVIGYSPVRGFKSLSLRWSGCGRVRGGPPAVRIGNAEGGSLSPPGQLAQRESARLTRGRSLVQSQYCPLPIRRRAAAARGRSWPRG